VCWQAALQRSSGRPAALEHLPLKASLPISNQPTASDCLPCRRNKCRQQIGEGLLSLHQAGVPQGLPPTAKYWRHLCYHAEFLDHVRWWKDGSDTIKLRADEVQIYCPTACPYHCLSCLSHLHIWTAFSLHAEEIFTLSSKHQQAWYQLTALEKL